MTDVNNDWGIPNQGLTIVTEGDGHNTTAFPSADDVVEQVAVPESPEAFIRRRDDEIQQWLELKLEAVKFVEAENAARKTLTDTLFPNPIKGTQRYQLNAGYSVKLVHGWTLTLGDANKISDQGTKISIEIQVQELEDKIKALGPEGELLVRRLIRWKPDLSATEYEKLAADEATETEAKAKELIDEILTVKPKAPALTFEEPKAPK